MKEIKEKCCSKCKIDKPIEMFSKDKRAKDGYQSSCKNCKKKYNKEHEVVGREYREKNKDKINEYNTIYYEENKEKENERNKKYYEENKNEINEQNKKYYNENKDKRIEYRKEYYEKNKKEISIKDKKHYKENKKEINKGRNDYFKRRKQIDPLFKLGCNMRTLIGDTLRNKGYTKKSRTHQILGLSFDELKIYIESLWEPWMSWDNYGSVSGKQPTGEKQCWDIDHIIRIATAKTEADIIRLNHYTNLQPLCSYVNRWIKK